MASPLFPYERRSLSPCEPSFAIFAAIPHLPRGAAHFWAVTLYSD